MSVVQKLVPAREQDKKFLHQVETEAGTSICRCYQCGKCTAGCPAAFAMDYPPRQLIRLLQLGMVDQALHAGSIWVCASCETCSARCPREVDIASVMDTMRRQALKRGIITDKKVAAFNRVFLTGVKSFGRTYEPGLLLQYNLTTRQFFKDLQLGLPMMTRGKIGLKPDKIKGSAEIGEIFARVKGLEEE